LKLNWDKTKRNNVSQFEKDLIEKHKNTFNNLGLFIGIGTSTGISFGVAFGSVYPATPTFFYFIFLINFL